MKKITSRVLYSLLLIVSVANYTQAGTMFGDSVALDIVGFNVDDTGNPVGAEQAGQVVAAVDLSTGDFATSFSDADPNLEAAPGSPSSPIWDVTTLSLSGNVDPIATLSFSVTNVSAAPAVLSFSTTLPTGPVGPSTLFGGSTSGTLSNANNLGGATIDPDPTLVGTSALYRGLIDGAITLELLDGFSASTALTTSFSDDAGLITSGGSAIPTIPGPAVSTSIGISQSFLLSPGDSATFSSIFIVEPVPEPSAILLASVALCFTASKRQRK